jgi:hypothetical protein
MQFLILMQQDLNTSLIKKNDQLRLKIFFWTNGNENRWMYIINQCQTLSLDCRKSSQKQSMNECISKLF